jgi:formamidase
MADYRTIHRDHHHFGWDQGLAPALRVEPDTEIEFGIVDASGGQLGADSTTEDVAQIDFSRVNPVTGPVFVEGAEPGDTLVVDLLEFEGSGWGWTAIIPGFGLLSDDFSDPFLHISRYRDGRIEFTPDIHLPLRPFPGTVGVALAEPGLHSVVPPRHVGGNLDIRDLVAGARLRLPVEVAGALFSIGDTHAAQGDGEVCGTAIESPMTLRLRLGLEKATSLRRPQFETPGALRGDEARSGYYATTGVGPDLLAASRDAVSDMIDHLGRHYGLDPQLAYALCSVAVDLKISEVVDVPNWVVSAYLPKGVFV